jgi:hypothetical protein
VGLYMHSPIRLHGVVLKLSSGTNFINYAVEPTPLYVEVELIATLFFIFERSWGLW